LLAPPFPMHREKQYDEDLKNLRTTLDIGSHINAQAEARATAH
jgi:hypothetical protein